MDQANKVNGKEMDDTMKTGQTMMDMKGTPMMCYQKKKVTTKENMNNDKENRLLEQSMKLLSMVMERIKRGEELDITFINQVTATLQNKTDVQPQNTTLGLEFMGIVDRLLQSGHTSGVSVSGEEPSMKSGGMTPMNDESSATSSISISLPEGFDLRSLGLSVSELLNLVKDPSMTFMFESLGFSPFLEFLRDEAVIEALSVLDLNSFNQLLISGDIFTADGQIDMETIQKYADRLQAEGEGVTMETTTAVSTDPPKLVDNPLLTTLGAMMALLGKETVFSHIM